RLPEPGDSSKSPEKKIYCFKETITVFRSCKKKTTNGSSEIKFQNSTYRQNILKYPIRMMYISAMNTKVFSDLNWMIISVPAQILSFLKPQKREKMPA